MSHLLQMRGLKLSYYTQIRTHHPSHLLQMRGLKPGIGSVTARQISRIFYRCVD